MVPELDDDPLQIVPLIPKLHAVRRRQHHVGCDETEVYDMIKTSQLRFKVSCLSVYAMRASRIAYTDNHEILNHDLEA